jgi:dipeptidyl-peptidase-4
VPAPEPAPDTFDLAGFPAAYARTARFTTGSPRNLTATAGGERVLFCRSRSATDPVLCLWAVDLGGHGDGGERDGDQRGRERLVVDPAQLGTDDADLPPAERARRERARESALGIVAFSTDRSGSMACFALAGSLFVVDIDTGRVHSPHLEGTVFDPRLDPAGTRVAYVNGEALEVLDVADVLGDSGPGPEGPMVPRLALSDDDPRCSHGRAEFIAAEEMQRSRGHWWSPDGSHLLVARVDENPVDEWWIADPAHPGRAPNPVRYPAAGTANAAVELHLVALDGPRRPVDWSDGGRFEYLADVIWQADHPPLVVRQTRDQRLVSIASLDEVTLAGDNDEDRAGEPAAAPIPVTEQAAITDDVWVELIPGAPRWCRSGLLTIEDRNGARRLVLDGHPLTGPGLQVRSLVATVDGTGATDPKVDGTDGELAVVTAWTDPTEIHLWAVPLDGGEPIPLTSTPGVRQAVVEALTMVVTTSSPERRGATTTVHRLTSSADGSSTSPALSEPVAAIGDRSADPGFRAEPVFVSLGADDLATALFMPRDHDGTTPLPVILDPYGGPHAQRVLKAHNPHLVSRWLAEQGYAVIVTDGRGTPGRGPDWERAVWGDLAGPVLDDQVAALDAALDRHPFLDPERVGIRGWSFGGYLAALAVLRRPDRFHAAVAGAPVTAWQLYDTHYTERYLGHPDTHPDHYRRSNLWAEGEPLNLRQPLLLIHGLADDNVVAAHTLRFSTELLANGCPHQVLPLSGVTHMTPQEAVAENLLRLQLRFFDDTIGTTGTGLDHPEEPPT